VRASSPESALQSERARQGAVQRPGCRTTCTAVAMCLFLHRAGHLPARNRKAMGRAVNVRVWAYLPEEPGPGEAPNAGGAIQWSCGREDITWKTWPDLDVFVCGLSNDAVALVCACIMCGGCTFLVVGGPLRLIG
jgi:hypothetical protein